MKKTIVVAGFGPGISSAVAERFGAEGYAVALVGRNAERLAAGVQALAGKGITAAAFRADLSDPGAMPALLADVRTKLGAVSVLHWNAYATSAGDALTADTAALHAVFDAAVTGLLAAVREALPDLKQAGGALLVTNGGLMIDDPKIDAMAVSRSVMGLAIANAAKHKLVGILAQKLKDDGVYVGEVVVTATVRGTSFDKGQATLDADVVGAKFWELFSARRETSARV